MAQNSNGLLKSILLVVYTFLADLIFGYTAFSITTLSLPIWLMVFAIGLILFLLVPWNIFVWKNLKQAIKKHKELKNNNNITQ